MGRDKVEGKDAGTGDNSAAILDVVQLLMERTNKPTGQEVRNIGQVDKINVPNGWLKGPNYDNRQHAASYQEFHPNEKDSECQLGFYYRGRRTSPVAGDTFHYLLEQPAHALSKEEYASLKEIVRDKYDPADFQVTNARTEDINGKRVLMVDGQYTGNKQLSHHMFIDADPNSTEGTAVQEIFFQAPADKFKNYSQAADDAMRTIRWK